MNKAPWLNTQKATLTKMYEAGFPVLEIAEAIGRSEQSVFNAVQRFGIHRAPNYVSVRKDGAWPIIEEALRESKGLTVAQIIEKTGIWKTTILITLGRHHGKGLYVSKWVRTARRPARVWALGDFPDAPEIGLKRPRQKRQYASPFSGLMGHSPEISQKRGRIYKTPDGPDNDAEK